jgi:hypothetical protein
MTGISKTGEKLGVREKIVQFLTKGDVLLHADEERILDRCTFTDGLIRSKKYQRDDIISMICQRFTVSKFTAERDITNAHSIFGSTRQISKKYLIGQHIEDIGLIIQAAKTDEALKPQLPKLLEAYTKAIQAMPDDISAGENSPTLLQFVFQGGAIDTGMTPDEAMKMAEKFMKRKAYAEDISYEELKDLESDEFGDDL